MIRAIARILVTAALAACLVAPGAATAWRAAEPPPSASDVRALWVVRTTLTSPAAIDRMVATARAAGFNTLLVQVRGRGDAYFTGGLDPRPSLLDADRHFDPLEATIARAHAAGLRVHAWVNVNLVAGANELPASREHVVYRHPEWLMVPRPLADALLGVDPHSPEYLGRLARYARSQSAEVEGIYLSPAARASVEYTAAVVRDIVERYPIDGVHLDYVRYPNDTFDYSRAALDAFRTECRDELAPAERQRLDARLAGDPLLYTRTFPERWRAFRAERMTMLVERVSAAVRGARPGTLVSAAVAPDAADAAMRRLQDWRAWIDRGLVDVVCPMAYTTDASVFADQIAAARRIAGTARVWAGIGAYRLTSAQIVDNVAAARQIGVGGIVLFSYDSLTSPDRGSDYLAQIARAAFLQ